MRSRVPPSLSVCKSVWFCFLCLDAWHHMPERYSRFPPDDLFPIRYQKYRGFQLVARLRLGLDSGLMYTALHCTISDLRVYSVTAVVHDTGDSVSFTFFSRLAASTGKSLHSPLCHTNLGRLPPSARWGNGHDSPGTRKRATMKGCEQTAYKERRKEKQRTEFSGGKRRRGGKK